MSYFILLPAGLCFALAAWLCYGDVKDYLGWYVQPLGIVIGGLTTWLWFLGADWAGGKNEAYRLGVWWTLEAECLWFLVPLVLGVRFGWLAVAGLTLVACGVLLIHADGGGQ